jgi:hypothetical protein
MLLWITPRIKRFEGMFGGATAPELGNFQQEISAFPKACFIRDV